MKYRAEVDGLRAIAVSAVLLFHAGLPFPQSGLLGVDVFFVLSGYLITTAIAQDLGERRFSLLKFYERRARRILPALLVMMAVATPFAWALMLPDDLENYGQSLIATAFFANNVLLYKTAGYFDLESEFKPLVHTWSLGVEEQYYVLVPLLMMAAYAVARRRGILFFTALVTVASFAACVTLSRRDPDANFYLLFSRGWELGAGALATLCQPALQRLVRNAKTADGLSLLGLSMILGGLFGIPTNPALPGWPTLIPIVGTCLVLLFGSTGGIAGKALAWRPVVFIGLISYSLYLYHQPVLVFLRIASLEEPPLWQKLSLLPLIVFLSYLSWRFVERPFRDRKRTPIPMLLGATGTAAGAVLAVGAAMYLTSGFYRNWPELAEGDPGFGARQNAEFNLRPLRYRGVTLEGAPDQAVLVLGNSFARDFVNMGLETGRLRPDALAYYDVQECAFPLPEKMMQAARNADYVVLASGPTRETADCVRRRVEELRAATNARVVVLGTKSFGWNNNAVMLLAPAERYSYRVSPLQTYADDNRHSRTKFDPSTYVDVLGKLADAEGRVPVFTPERKFISQDRRHLTQAGARYVGQIVFSDPIFRGLSAPQQGGRASAVARQADLLNRKAARPPSS